MLIALLTGNLVFVLAEGDPFELWLTVIALACACYSVRGCNKAMDEIGAARKELIQRRMRPRFSLWPGVPGSIGVLNRTFLEAFFYFMVIGAPPIAFCCKVGELFIVLHITAILAAAVTLMNNRRGRALAPSSDGRSFA